MLAKLTSKNQITLPKAVVSEIDAAEYFDVSVDNDRIVLTPIRIQQAQLVRDKLLQLGITEHPNTASLSRLAATIRHDKWL